MDPSRVYFRDLERIDFLSAAEERRLAVRMRAGDTCARNRLVESVLPMVTGMAKRMPLDRNDTADAAADLALYALSVVERFDGRSRLTTLVWIAMQHRIGLFRQRFRRHRERHRTGVALRERRDRRVPQPDEIAMGREERAIFRERLRFLPERLRSILLRRAAGETLAEIGSDLGLSKERVRQLFDKGLVRLRREYGCEDAPRIRGAELEELLGIVRDQVAEPKHAGRAKRMRNRVGALA